MKRQKLSEWGNNGFVCICLKIGPFRFTISQRIGQSEQRRRFFIWRKTLDNIVAATPVSTPPHHDGLPPARNYCRTIFIEYAVIVFVIGGLEAVCLMDWRSLFWAALLLAVLRLHAAFWGKILPKRLQPLGILVGCTVILLPLFALHHIVWAYWLNPIKISKATTYATEPLTPDGKRVDFFTTLEQRITPNVPPEENGFRMLVQALGPRVLGCKIRPLDRWEQNHWDDLCKKMRLNPEDCDSSIPIHTSLREWLRETETAKDPEPKNSDEYLEWQKRIDSRMSEVCKRLNDDLLRLDENPDIVQWFETNNEIFDLFSKAVRKPVFFTPLLQDENYPSLYFMHHISMPTTISLMLKQRIRYYLEKGETERAWCDVLTCYEFTEHELKNAFNGQMIYTPMTLQPDKQVIDVLRRDHLSLETLSRYKNDVERFLVPLNEKTLENVKFGDRLFCLDLVLRFTYDPGWTGPIMLPRIFAWNQAVIDFNRHFEKVWIPPDRMYRPENKHDWYPREETRLEKIRFVTWYLIVKGVSKAFPSSLADFALATQGNVCGCGFPHDSFDNRQVFVWRRFVKLAFALEEYRLTNGEYPYDLMLLKQIDESLEWSDPFAEGHAFRYERRLPNGFILYSVGSNGVDDLGVEDYVNKKDDIKIQMP